MSDPELSTVNYVTQDEYDDEEKYLLAEKARLFKDLEALRPVMKSKDPAISAWRGKYRSEQKEYKARHEAFSLWAVQGKDLLAYQSKADVAQLLQALRQRQTQPTLNQ